VTGQVAVTHERVDHVQRAPGKRGEGADAEQPPRQAVDPDPAEHDRKDEERARDERLVDRREQPQYGE
jgi:hypothetical protein